MLNSGVHVTAPVHAITLLLQITLLKATPPLERPDKLIRVHVAARQPLISKTANSLVPLISGIWVRNGFLRYGQIPLVLAACISSTLAYVDVVEDIWMSFPAIGFLPIIFFMVSSLGKSTLHPLLRGFQCNYVFYNTILMYGCLVCIWRNYPAKIFCLTVSLPLYAVAGLGDAYPEKGRVLMCRIFFFFNALQLTVINLVLVLSLTAVDDVIFTMLHWSVSIATVSIGSTATLLGFAVTNLASSLLHPEALAVLRCSIYPCKLYPGTLLLLEEAHNLLDDSGIDEKMKSRTQYKYLESVTSPARRATSENDLQKAGETDLDVGQGLNLEEVLSRLKEMGQDLSALKEHYKVLTTFADHSGTADGVEIFFGFRKEELVEDLNFLARKILEILPSFRQQSSRSTAVIRVHFPWMAPRRMLTADTVWPTLSGAYLKVKFLRYGALIALWFFSAVSAFLVWSGLFEQWWLGVAVVGSLPEIMLLCSGFNRKMLTVLTTSFQTLFVWFHTCLLFFSFGVLWRGESLKLACLCLMLPSFLSSACMDALQKLVVFLPRAFSSHSFWASFLPCGLGWSSDFSMSMILRWILVGHFQSSLVQ